MPRGGKRQNAGRKADPARDAKLGAAKAQALLEELQAYSKLKKDYAECGDARLRTYIFFKLFELGFGKAAENVELSGKGGGPVPVSITTNINLPDE